MNIKVHSSELNRMMKIVTQCIDPRSAKLGNIEIRHEDSKLTIRGTNGSFHATVMTPLLGGDGESFCVDGSMFAKVCAMCSGEVGIRTDGKTCTIKGAGRTRLPIVDVEIPGQEPVEGTLTVMAADDFVRCYEGVAYAVAAEQTRIQLTGVLCEFGEYGVKMVSLDGFQMSVDTAKCSGDAMKAIIPGAFMKLISQGTCSGENISIQCSESRIEAYTDSMMISCGKIAGEYPDYNRILPREFKTECMVKTDELRSALKCGSIIASKRNLVKLEIGADSIRVTSNSEEADYDAEVPCETRGDGLQIAFNQKYMMNLVNAVDADEIILQFNSPVTPCVAHGKDRNGVRLLLPVRVAG